MIGTGSSFKPLDDGAITKLKSFGVKFDVLDTVSFVDQFTAVSTYNVSCEDGINLVGFLLPGLPDGGQKATK